MEKANARNPRYFHDYDIIRDCIGHLVMISVVAFFFSLLFEAPVRTLECMIFRRRAVSKFSKIKKDK
ncbi:hypothetical protein TSAR_010983 [Trichomalopsis sarcophagae]|uniref:Uncharacterized protein n=1 Tax=Trichomalopsis sarcophagae TaxID=543379 RepID=A0A232EWU6_9HYME|nr:hypothetical protein TSAR_010983 [Trichomalopsis sarcophagae]